MKIDLKRDGVRAAGSWESYPNRVRALGSRPALHEQFEWEHTEDFVKGLAERGFNLYIAHFSKGHGIETERPYYARLRGLVELCHRYGIAVGGYMRYTTIMPETLRREVPDCLERFAGRTGAGLYARYAKSYWRYIPCPCSQEWLDYLDRIIAIGVNEIGLDLIHIDGTTLWPEPEACHCPRCQKAFCEYLEAKYPNRDARVRIFGFADLSFIELPYYGTPGSFVRPKALTDPVAKEWLLFRCQRMTEIWQFLVNAVKKRRPEVWVDGNIKYEPGMNTAWDHSNDLYALHRVPCEAFYTEEPNSPELRPDGAVVSYISTFKKARQFGKKVLCYNRAGPPTYREFSTPEQLSLGYAHQMAFNNDAIGCHIRFSAGSWPAYYEPYVRFHRDHRDLFSEGELLTDVGVYYSTRSLAFNFREPHLGILLAQQALIHQRVPFGFLFGEEVRWIDRYRAIILADVECLSDEEVEAIAAYVRGGGGLVVAGQAGTCDELRHPQPIGRLAIGLGLCQAARVAHHYQRVGRGRVAYLPPLVPDVEASAHEGGHRRGEWVEEFVKGSDIALAAWRSPRNAADFLDAVRWAAGGFSFEVLAPGGVVCEYVRQPVRNRVLVHLVNFDLGRDVEGIEVTWHGAGGAIQAEAFTPDDIPPGVEAFPGEDRAILRLARLHRYVILALTPPSDATVL